MLVASQFNDNDLIRAALLHDASEAYIGDIVTGFKSLLPDYKVFEDRVQKLIYKKYHVVLSDFDEFVIKNIDTRIVLDEALGIIPDKYELYKNQLTHVEPLGIEINGNYKPQFIKDSFLNMCKEFDIGD